MNRINVTKWEWEEKKPSNSRKRIEFLDGYRGLLALIALMSNCQIYNNSHLINIFNGHEYYYSISGFFVLSAFLLTYHLLEDFGESNLDLNRVINSSLKSFIRRFFRVYIVYIIYLTPFTLFVLPLTTLYPNIEYEPNVLNIIFLSNPGNNYLWPIPCAIKYFFFIPVFCFLARISRRFSPLFLFASLLWTAYDQVFNFFDIIPTDLSYESDNIGRLSTHFGLFLMGSQVALTLHLLERNESSMRYLKLANSQRILKYASILVAIFGFDNTTGVNPGLYWSILLLMSLLCEKSTMRMFLENSSVLKYVGTRSFGFYLFSLPILYSVRYIGLGMGILVHSDIFYCLVAFLLDLMVSFFSFRFIESHLIRFAEKLCYKLD